MLEDLLGREWDDLAAQHGQAFDVPYEVEPGRSTPLTPVPGRARAGEIEVAPWGLTSLRRVCVTVRWRTGTDPSELRLETLVGRK